MFFPNLNFIRQNFREPLLDKHLGERIRYAKSRYDFFISITTNGSLLNHEMGIDLIESGLDRLAVSLDPGSAEMHDRFRSPLSHEKIVSNLKQFVALKKELSTSKPLLVVASVVYKGNESYVRDFLDFWRPQVDNVTIRRVRNWGREQRQPTLVPCWRLWQTFTVQWDGTVSLCCQDYAGKHILGDLRDSSIMEIWKSEQYRLIRRASLSGVMKDDFLCKTCALVQNDALHWIKEIL